MQSITAKADKQTTSLFDFMFWSDVVVILAIVGLNIVNLSRANTAQGALVSVAEPQLVFIVSLALIMYLCYGCYTALATKKRFGNVFVTLDDAGVSGYSLPHPATGERGEAFTASYDDIVSVSLIEVAVSRKHIAPALKIETEENSFVVPAPERVKELVNQIAERMKQK